MVVIKAMICRQRNSEKRLVSTDPALYTCVLSPASPKSPAAPTRKRESNPEGSTKGEESEASL